MARSRNLKPGFFKNEDLAACGMAARILFAGLWCFADRQGRLEDRPKRIKAEIFPYDTVDIDAELDILHNAKFIKRYEKTSEKFIQIINFTKHQNPHIKEHDSIIPAPDKHQTSTGNSGTCHALTLNPITDSLNPINGAIAPVVSSTSVLAERIWKDIQTLNPKHKAPDLAKWANDVRLMVERDGRTTDEILALWAWANNHDFWQTNILSPATLRKQWDKLTIQKNSKTQPQTSKGKIHRALEACDKVFGPMNKGEKP